MAQPCGILVASSAVLISASLSASTLTVSRDGGADHTDIQPAIDAANDGGTVLVPSLRSGPHS
jgi:polygalacturonase